MYTFLWGKKSQKKYGGFFSCKINMSPCNIVPHEGLLWHLVLARFNEIWGDLGKILWDTVRFHEIWSDLVRFREIWWDFVRFREIWWAMMRFGTFSEIWWEMVRFDEILCDIVRFGRIWWDSVKFYETWWDLVVNMAADWTIFDNIIFFKSMY